MDPKVPTEALGCSGIVLAGGRSSRFGRDKLAQPVGGRPLLHHAVLALGAVCQEVIVVLAPDAPEPVLPEEAPVPVLVVRDPEPFGGPLVGIVAGLERARQSLVLVAGGDMPALRPELLRLLVRMLDSIADDGVALVYRGRLQPLPCAVRNGAALPAARALIGLDERSVLALLRSIRARRLSEQEWRALDPSVESLVDVDRPEDLKAGSPAE